LAFDLGSEDTDDLNDSTDGSELNDALGQTISADTGTEDGYILAYQGGDAFLFHTDPDANGGAAIADGDVALVGIFEGVGVGEFTGSNFIDT
jgi:hypothetical protein